MYKAHKIEIVKMDDNAAAKLAQSVNKFLNVKDSQLFYPGFQTLDSFDIDTETSINSSMYHNKLFNSRYKCLEVVGLIDEDYEFSETSSMNSAAHLTSKYAIPNDTLGGDYAPPFPTFPPMFGDIEADAPYSPIFPATPVKREGTSHPHSPVHWRNNGGLGGIAGRSPVIPPASSISSISSSDNSYNSHINDSQQHQFETYMAGQQFMSNDEHTHYKYGIHPKSASSASIDDTDDIASHSDDYSDISDDVFCATTMPPIVGGYGGAKSPPDSKPLENTKKHSISPTNSYQSSYNEHADEMDEMNEMNGDSPQPPESDALDKYYDDGITKYLDDLKLGATHNELLNHYVVLSAISHNNLASEDNLTKMFIKKSPLLEPMKVARGMYYLQCSTTLPDIISINTVAKLNNVNNSSHVEALFLYLANKLVEDGKTLAFPYYYGCINAIDPNFHVNINDQYDDIADESWFQTRIATDLSLVITDNNCNIVQSQSCRNTHPSSDAGGHGGDFAPLASPQMMEQGQEKEQEHKQLLGGVGVIEMLNIDSAMEIEDIEVTEHQSLSHLKKIMKSDMNYFLKVPNMPVNLLFMEYMEETLDNLMDNGYELNEIEWQALIFQVAFGLAVANKQFSFVHNDLHCSNIMIQKTKEPYIYYKIKNRLYQIPTFGRIYKIIDFARATFQLDTNWIFSDVFNDGNDAADQYPYIPDSAAYVAAHDLVPNPSFDLVRFAVSAKSRLQHVPMISTFFNHISRDRYGSIDFMEFTSFDLYIHIANNCTNARPIKVLQNRFFDRFITTDEASAYVFTY